MFIKVANLEFVRGLDLKGESLDPVYEKICTELYPTLYDFEYKEESEEYFDFTYLESRDYIYLKNKSKSMSIFINENKMTFLWISKNNKDYFKEFSKDNFYSFIEQLNIKEFLLSFTFKKIESWWSNQNNK